MRLTQECVFDLPELAEYVADNLPQQSLGHCVRVSKSWHAIFIQYLWWTFADKPETNWDRLLKRAIRKQVPTSDGQDIEWFKDVYRRHAHDNGSSNAGLSPDHHCPLTNLQSLVLRMPFSKCDEYFGGPAFTSGDSSDSDSSSSSSSSYSSSSSSSEDDMDDSYPDLILIHDSPTDNSLADNSSDTDDINMDDISPDNINMAIFNTGGINADNVNMDTFNTDDIDADNSETDSSDTGDSFHTDSSDTGNSDTEGLDTDISDGSSVGELFLDQDGGVRMDGRFSSEFDVLRRILDACWRLVLLNPRLKTLDCIYHPSFYGRMLLDPTALTGLRSLQMALAPEGLPVMPSSVTHFRTRGSGGMWCNGAFDPTGPPHTVRGHLQELEVEGLLSVTHIRRLLAQAPNLDTLRIINMTASSSESEAVAAEENETCWLSSKVRVLKHRCRNHWQRRGVAETLRYFPFLVEYHATISSTSVLRALVKYCPLLEVVRVHDQEYDGRYYPRHNIRDKVSVLLTGLPRLRVLEMPLHVIDAKEVRYEPWVYLGLEEFRCQIAGMFHWSPADVERLTTYAEQKAASSGDPSVQHLSRKKKLGWFLEGDSPKRSARKAVLLQPSRLTSLKHLSFSPGPSQSSFGGVQRDTLHFRLDSSLRHLESLTELEYLGFELLDHRMGTAEIEWIAKTFSKLREMRGLVVESGAGVEFNPETGALHKLMQALRPDTVHRESMN
ncbi:hypothetical protein BGX33_005069 [Mortierella sp. NVP41]|nr:hypothetical protein BGX33_005069 [Mortierella sp. NVP41]